jgi:hypothetical protein
MHLFIRRAIKLTLKDIDDGALHFCILFIRTLFIVQFNKITTFQRLGLRQFGLMDFILDHLCVVSSPLLTSQLILFIILSFYLSQTF